MSNLFSNNNVLKTMFSMEKYYQLKDNYLDMELFTESMRSILAKWMLDVCEEENKTNQIFSHSINLFDRLMNTLINVNKFKIDKSYLQLFGTCCLFLSSKLRSNNQLDSFRLVEYTDNSITLKDLLDVELFILETLKWDIDSIIANDYLEFYLNKFDLNNLDNIELIKKNFYILTSLCSTEIRFSYYLPSQIALSCLLAALDGLNINLNYSTLFKQFDLVQVKYLKEQISSLVDLNIRSEMNLSINSNSFMDDDSILSIESVTKIKKDIKKKKSKKLNGKLNKKSSNKSSKNLANCSVSSDYFSSTSDLDLTIDNSNLAISP